MREPGEDYLKEATIQLLDETDAEALNYRTDGGSQPFCAPDLQRRTYMIAAEAPAGYGLTGAARLDLDLRGGGDVLVEFGAWPGYEAADAPLLQPVAPDDISAETKRPAILRELSGLFVLMLAGLVFFSGMALSIFLRGR